MKVLIFYGPDQSPNWVYALPGEDEAVVFNPALYPELGPLHIVVDVVDASAFTKEDAILAITALG